MDFSGRLAAFPPGDLLQWAANDRRTGALIVRRRSREKRVYLQEGRVVACSSDDPAEFYGRHLLLGGHLSEDDLVLALSHCQRHDLRLGESLEQLGLLSAEKIAETLSQYVADSVCGLFLWPHGVFYLEETAPPPRQILQHPLDSMRLSLQGARWLDEYARIRRVFVHDEVVLRRAGTAPARRPSACEQYILREVDGKRSLERLHRSVGGSYFRFLQAALALAVDGLLDLDEVGELSAPPTMEINLRDVLAEEGQERDLPVRRGLSLQALHWMVPVAVGDPQAAEADSEPHRRLRARCDGYRTLAEVLGEDEALSEIFLQTLLGGRLALLPKPVPELEGKAALDRVPAADRWWRRLFEQDAAEYAQPEAPRVSS
jgi:hypothetical protein